MKENYKAWDINIEDFYKQKTDGDKLRFLLNFAVLAPSSHNSQPWSFEVKEGFILLYPEIKRRLIESDKNNRQLYISLGCAIENIIVAANYYGYLSDVDYSFKKTTATKISFSKIEKNIDDKSISSILSRSMNRNKYDNTPLPDSFLEKIKLLNINDLNIHIVENKNDKNLLADITLNAAINAMDDKDFRRELSKYVKSNITKSKTGMPGFSLGIPTPISLIIPTLLKYINVNKLSRKQDEKLLKDHTPMFVVISTKDDDKESWINAGRIFERIAIIAESNKIKISVLAAPIQIGEYYKDFQKVLQTNYRPQVFFRIGYSEKKPKHSPRLEVSDVVK